MSARVVARRELQRAVRLGRRFTTRRVRRPAAPPTAPDGWRTAAPDFIGIGSTGAATAWWLAQIERHPEVARAPGAPVATHWFERYWEECPGPDAADRYARYFPRPAGSRAGEWTPSYLSTFWVPPLLAQVAPDARVLVLLADPLTRFLAAFARATEQQPRRWDERDAIGAFIRGLNAEALRSLLRHVPRERVLIQLEESCRADPATELERTLAHLGVAPGAPLAAPTLPQPAAQTDPGARVPQSIRRAISVAYAREVEQLAELAAELELDRWSPRP